MKFLAAIPKRNKNLISIMQAAPLVPLIYAINTDNTIMQIIIWPILIVLVVIGFYFKIRNHYELRANELYISAIKQSIAYSAITGMVSKDFNSFEIDYTDNGELKHLLIITSLKQQMSEELAKHMRAARNKELSKV